MTTYMTVRPAYGRVYRTKAEVLAAWNGGLDFQITDYGRDEGRKINKTQLPAGVKVQVRYGPLNPDGIGTKVLVIK